MARQRSITRPSRITDTGLFHADRSTLTFKPAPPGHGVVFVRSDLRNARVPALADHVVPRARRTALRLGEAVVETTEHVLSAVWGLGIDNLIIELDGSEVPNVDGSATPFLEALRAAEPVEQDADREVFELIEPVSVRQDDAALAALPSDEPGMHVVYDLNYSRSPEIGRQVFSFSLGRDDYPAAVARSRTFSLRAEAEAALSQGLFTHLTPKKALVIGADGPIDNTLRYADEPVRHKVLDLIGDLALIGVPVQAKIVASRSGHPLNQKLAAALLRQVRGQRRDRLSRGAERFDVRALFRMMPHRYPMLLVDRVLELDGVQRAVGVKNVTINEPFFQGHYPSAPIMPGVLVVEAMAQLSGVLIGQNFDQIGKLPVLLSMDRVKLRRPVTPGDQLILEAEAVRIRSRIAHMRCRAYVAEELAAEAEVKFMLTDKETA